MYSLFIYFRLLFLSLWFYAFSISSQNLIGNGGFDIHTKCPNRISQIRFATGWTSSGSPDLFCTCTQTKSAVYAALSFVGSLLPHSGDCYSGFIVNPQYKEYLTYELSQKTRRRRTYCIRFLYSRSAFSGVKVDSLGIYLHKKMYDNAVRGQPMHQKTAAVKIVDHPGVWKAVSFTFTCKGGERYITIGSFSNDLRKVECLSSKKYKKNVRIFNYVRSGYYFIDDIELVSLHNGETCLPVSLPVDTPVIIPVTVEPPAEQIDTAITARLFVLHELNFETNKSEILPTSFDELNELADHLMSQQELSLFIMGHTDNRGNKKINMQLSEARAHAVANYLFLKGITRERLRWQGFGDSKPVASNTTEDGRRRNRRVEFQLREN
jgi:OOP family OmpA-OmpF porin